LQLYGGGGMLGKPLPVFIRIGGIHYEEIEVGL
jgi:hypothetical protein